MMFSTTLPTLAALIAFLEKLRAQPTYTLLGVSRTGGGFLVAYKPEEIEP